MKITLEFNLPKEQELFDFASNGARYNSILYNLDYYLENQINNLIDNAIGGEEELKENCEYNTLRKTRKYLHQCLESHKLYI